MSTPEVQRLKMAWLAAKEAGDVETQMSLLRDHPGEQAALIDFIAAYHASGGDVLAPEESELLPLTQRACQSALERVFTTQAAFANLAELRRSRRLSKIDVASGLRLSVDVWNKFEAGAIELASLSRRQLERLAGFFQIGAEQFAGLLDQSQPALTLNRRQTREAASHEQQGPRRQSFAEALARSTMPEADRRFWLDQEM